MSAHMWVETYWLTEKQNTNELPLRGSVRMKKGVQLCPVRGEHKNRGVNRRKNDIDKTIEQYTSNCQQ